MAAFVFLRIAICTFGIVGNTLVIALILKQNILFIKNYDILVLHLAICNVLALLSIFFIQMESIPFIFRCSYISGVGTVFKVSGVSMMLIISVIRYRAIVHPLKLSFSRRKIKIFCGLAYINGLVTTVGLTIKGCILDPRGDYLIYELFFFYVCVYIFPIIIMTGTYFIIARALIKREKTPKELFNLANLWSSTS